MAENQLAWIQGFLSVLVTILFVGILGWLVWEGKKGKRTEEYRTLVWIQGFVNLAVVILAMGTLGWLAWKGIKWVVSWWR